MNNRIIYEELATILEHMRADEMRINRIMNCLRLAEAHEKFEKELGGTQ
jgi:hypothetical protein